MSSWRDKILKEFTPQVARLTLVADPDGLLTEEGIIHGLQERGFELISFEDPIAFRYAYESKYRSRWDRGEPTELVVVLRAEAHDLTSLPYDLLKAGRKLTFNLGDLFPNLSYPVVEALDRAALDELYHAQVQYKPKRLGDNATKDFVLLHVFETAPELIRNTSDLLKILVRRHFRGRSIPSALDERFIQVLRQKEVFEDWPLEDIIPDGTVFFAFLQERWPFFLDAVAVKSADTVSEKTSSFNLEYGGPADIPFDHDDVRVYIDNLFLEGMLKPVSHPKARELSKTWVSVGLQIDPKADRLKRLERLLKRVESSLPSQRSNHQDWLAFAHRWAELIVLASEAGITSGSAAQEEMAGLRKKVDEAFLNWIENSYGTLHNLPPVPPVMLHHVPRAMARKAGPPRNEKIALIVVDGMSMDQWVVIRDVLNKQRSEYRFREGAVYAWIPTLTSVSRQTLFAGKAPFYFPASISTTTKEPSHWQHFWLDKGFTQTQIAYMKGLGNGDFEQLREMLEHPQVRIAGLVIDKIDKIMHGMELGTAGMHNQVRQWAHEGYMAQLFGLLDSLGFRVWLTSDHGNIEAQGFGRPTEGAIADVKGERARVYPYSLLRSKIKEKFPETIEWAAIGLPEDFFALLAGERLAFIHEGKRTVAHGSLSIEEVIVPLVEIKRTPAALSVKNRT